MMFFNKHYSFITIGLAKICLKTYIHMNCSMRSVLLDSYSLLSNTKSKYYNDYYQCLKIYKIFVLLNKDT